MIPNKTILIVDDEPRSLQGLRKLLEAWSAGRFRILSTDNGVNAISLLQQEVIHLLITDIRMPEVSGLQVAEAVGSGRSAHQPAIIVISGYAEFAYAQKAIQLGVVQYLLKPINKKKLVEAVEQALKLEEQRNRVGWMTKIVDPKLLMAKEGRLPVSEPIESAVHYVEQHLATSFSLREVAEYVHLNPSYFSALFKEQMSVTFSEYVTRSRLQKAKELLLSTRLPIWEIADRVGYATTKYFVKLFKDYEGKSPGQYRSELADEIQK